MTSHDFDSARAAQGAPVQFCKTGGSWVDVHYVGPDRVRGGHFVQFGGGDVVSTSALRMKPMPTTKWVLEFTSAQQAADAVIELLGIGWTDHDVLKVKEIEIPNPAA